MQALDLFAGAGGWDVAAAHLGITTHGVENMPAARATRAAAGLSTIHDDVWTLGELLEQSATAPLFDLHLASPPCQTFSKAGKRGADVADVLRGITSGAYRHLARLRGLGQFVGDERTALVLTPLHYAAKHLPEAIAWEQVPDVLPVWEACASVLRESGYSVWTGKLQAEAYGVPQNRIRAVLLASRVHEVGEPPRTHSRFYRHAPARLDAGVPRWVSFADAMQAIGEPLDVPADHWSHHRPSTTVVGSFKPEVQAGPGYRKPGDGPRQNAANSITTTMRQASALQSFPADFPWQGSASAQRLQVGNAIPPGLALAALAENTGLSVTTITDTLPAAA